MNTADGELGGVLEILERKRAELVHVVRNRDGITIEKSADQMDEIQYASERDLAIRNVDRDSALLRQVKAALGRIRDGSFGACIGLRSQRSARSESPPCHGRCVVSSARKLPTASGQDAEDVSETLVNAA